MGRIAALVVLVALVVTGVVFAGEVNGEQSGEPPSTKPPSTSGAVAAPPAAPATTPHPEAVVSSRLPASDRGEVSTLELDVATAAVPPITFDPSDTAPGWQERKGRAALALVPYDVGRVGFRIKFMGARSGYRGGTFPYEELIEIHVRPELSVEQIAWDIAHEIGHAYDWVLNTPAERELFKQVRGYGSKAGWRACSGCNDFSTPAGDFAESFAYWTMNGSQPFRGRIAPPPTEEQRILLASLFTE